MNIRSLLHEPVLHFLVIGAAISAAGGLFQSNHDRYRIVMTKERVGDIAQRYAAQYGAAPRPDRLDFLIEADIRNEILYREGLSLNLGRDDEIVRRRIIQKAEFLLQDLKIDAAPSEGDLEAYHRDHEQDYKIPARVSFTHVYFSADRDGAAAAKLRAEATLGDLRAKPLLRARQLGDNFSESYDYTALSRTAVVRVFGDGPFAKLAFEAPVGEWCGPVESGLGWHLIRITSREVPRTPPFDEVKEKVQAHWADAARTKANNEGFARIRAKYRIIRKDE